MVAVLLLTLEPGRRETAFSFASRLAARNGLEAAEFGSDLGVPFRAIIDGQPEAVARIAALGGADATGLTEWSPHHLGAGEHRFRNERFHARAIKRTVMKGCTACLREDAAGSDLPPPQAMCIRGSWMPRHSTICQRHELPLVPLWTEKEITRRHETATHFARLAPSILSGELDPPSREVRPFDVWFETRLSEGPGEGWLDQFPLYPAAHFCELLGRAAWARHLPKLRRLSDEERWRYFDLGYHFASRGADAIRAALTAMQETAGTPNDGPKSRFGDLYDRLAHDLTGDDYSVFRDLLRRHIAETWPLGPGDELMGEPVLERRVHSALTAARETGQDPRRLRKLLADAGWVRPAGEGREDAWELFDSLAAGPFLSSLNRQVSARELQETLHMSRSQFDLLRQDGYLAPSMAGHEHKPLWDLAAGRSFIEGILDGAETVYIAVHGWCDIATAAQRLKVRPGQILRMIETGKVRRVGRYTQRDGYAAILVDVDDVERALERPEAKGVSIAVFAKTNGLTPAVAGRLVRRGHTPSTRDRNPKTGAEQTFLSAGDVVAFHRRFVTLGGLSTFLRQEWQSLIPRLKATGVPRFSPDGEDYGALYLWSDVEERLVSRWPRPAGASRKSMHT